jgi:hypothetical protein
MLTVIQIRIVYLVLDKRTTTIQHLDREYDMGYCDIHYIRCVNTY